jgi:sterol desaturase/sphingolipid hydroxylase (fatty acid hydroxylase superfamily)
VFGFFRERPLEQVLLIILVFQMIRYVLLAGGAFLAFWVLGKERLASVKLDSKPFQWKDAFREMRWSFLTMLIFLLPGAAVIHFNRSGQTLMYTDIATHGGLVWFSLSILLMLAVHDLYFYIIHRSMHHPVLYRYFHEVHHRSLNPTPWAAFSFHPLEALLESGIIYLFVFLIPVHAGTIFVFQLLSLVMNVYGHLGHDVAPAGWRTHGFLKYINTTRNHHWHHQRFNGNYGLYTTLWDRWLGTFREV